MWSEPKRDEQLKDGNTLADEAAIDAAFAILAAIVVVGALYLIRTAIQGRA